jgi:hypothetical protein
MAGTAANLKKLLKKITINDFLKAFCPIFNFRLTVLKVSYVLQSLVINRKHISGCVRVRDMGF